MAQICEHIQFNKVQSKLLVLRKETKYIGKKAIIAKQFNILNAMGVVFNSG